MLVGRDTEPQRRSPRPVLQIVAGLAAGCAPIGDLVVTQAPTHQSLTQLQPQIRLGVIAEVSLRMKAAVLLHDAGLLDLEEVDRDVRGARLDQPRDTAAKALRSLARQAQ